MDFTSSNVASIFKILVGTMLAIVLSSLIVEFFNVTLTSTFVRGTVTKSIEKSCDFFAQETYVRDKDATTDVKVYNVVQPIYFSDNTVAVSADFFDGDTQKEIYDSLYKNSEFKSFAKKYGDKWLNLRRLGYGLWSSDYTNGTSICLSNFDKTAGKQYANTFVTALNSGITYLDKEALEKIAKWNMVSNFYGGNSETLYKGDVKVITGESDKSDDYVMYDGYKIYFNTLHINDIKYDVYDLTKTAEAEKFAKRTGVGWNSVTNSVDMDYWKNTVGLDSSDERRYVCVADIDYDVVISYDGITPIKKIFQYFIGQSTSMKNRATSNADMISEYQQLSWQDNYTIDDRAFYYRRNSEEALASTSDYSLLDFNGRVTYYIIR